MLAASKDDPKYTTLKNDIEANAGPGGALEAMVAAGQDLDIANWYNQVVVGSKVWKPKVTVEELNRAIVWADFVGLTVQRQNAYVAMTQAGYIEATDQQVRTGLVSIFGAGTASVNAILQIARRDGTRLELLFASAEVQNARVSEVFGVQLSDVDVARALRPNQTVV